jgi:hypothetical protein
MKPYLVVFCCTFFLFAGLLQAQKARDRAVMAADPSIPCGLDTPQQGKVFIMGFAGVEKYTPDGAQISHAELRADQKLFLRMQYGGGCERHDLSLHAELYHSPNGNGHVLNLYLSHNAHNDMCEALLGREMEFDLTEVMDVYATTYTHGKVQVRVFEPGSDKPVATDLSLEF